MTIAIGRLAVIGVGLIGGSLARALRELLWPRRREVERVHALLERVNEIVPKVHVFGHIHECPGVESHNGTTFVNAATGFGRGRAFTVQI